jgi:hypothetical protein
MSLFQKGQPKTGGRRKGTRDRIATALLDALAKDFEEHGEEAVRITRVERPAEYLKIMASILPKELEISHSRIEELTDEQIATILRITGGSDSDSPESSDSRKEPTLN